MTRRLHAAIDAFHAMGADIEAPEIPKARAKPVQREHLEQAAVIKYWRYAHKGFGVPEIALFATPNGGPRRMLNGVRLKAEGVRAGVSDLTLAVPRGKYAGAFIEMKAAKGVVSEVQAEFQKQMELLGYRAVTCYGATEAIQFITQYIKGEHSEQT